MKGAAAEFKKHLSVEKISEVKDEISFSLCIPFPKKQVS
jgi:hypothetical protein